MCATILFMASALTGLYTAIAFGADQAAWIAASSKTLLLPEVPSAVIPNGPRQAEPPKPMYAKKKERDRCLTRCDLELLDCHARNEKNLRLGKKCNENHRECTLACKKRYERAP